MKLLTVPEMLAVEKAADASGHSYEAMMAAAGRGLAEWIQEIYGGGETTLLALAGKGNNGGDALVALVHLADWGWSGAVILVGREEDRYVRAAARAGWAVHTWPEIPVPSIREWLDAHAVVLDGILGTGIRLPLRGPAQEVLAAIRDDGLGGAKLVAVDTPSGLDCRSGDAAPETPYADLTVTMAAAKSGFYRHPAVEHLGRLVVAGIGVPADLPAWDSVRREVLDDRRAAAWLPDRPPDGHKGTFGTAWIVGGSHRYVGAALLAGLGAFRSGAGLVTTAVPRPIYRLIAGQFPESTWLPLPEADGAISGDAVEILEGDLHRADALAVGPGIGRSAAAAAFLENLLRLGERLPRLLIDADALRLIARMPDWPARLPSGTILTPHPGEMAALTGQSTAEIQADRIAAAETHAESWGHVVVLKGAFTVIAAPDGRTALVPISTPALARAGTGDVLAGMIMGLAAQGLSAFEAAALGAYLHGVSGELAAELRGDAAAVLAGDVADRIGEAAAELRRVKGRSPGG